MSMIQPTELLVSSQEHEVTHFKWCVYFDVQTEDIITVTNKPRSEIEHPYLMTSSSDAKDILMGILNPSKYCVIELAEGYKLVEKGEGLRIKDAESYLSKLPIVEQNQDVNCIFYINSWKLEINFNQDTLFKMTGRRYHKEISINLDNDGKYDNVVLYLIKGNDPNFLIATIEVDTKELIHEGYIIYDLHKLRNICGLGEINVLTKKIFKTYGVKRKQNFVRAEFSRRRDRRRLIHDIQEHSDIVINSFTISMSEGGYYIQSNFAQPDEQKIYGDVNFYLVDKNNVNKLISCVVIPYDDVGYNKNRKIETNIAIENCKIMTKEENRNLTFDMQLQENIHD